MLVLYLFEVEQTIILISCRLYMQGSYGIKVVDKVWYIYIDCMGTDESDTCSKKMPYIHISRAETGL